MPTTRRSSGPAQKGTQKTLSFTNTSKISKAASTPSTLKTKSSITKLPNLTELAKPSPASPDLKPSTLPTTPPKPTSQPKPKPQTAHQTLQTTLASQISDAKIRKYWKAREDLRLAPRVHQKDLEISEKILREWDCMSQFGPAIGISRTKRWHRASRLGLNPPLEVLAVLLKEEEKKNKAVERAYVDELMGAKGIIGGDAV
ncbi:putative dna polymerase delta subunit 4 protein [Botrytis fragariae]|uniref:Putative dna polymerase delta subunit 4 protein n=1 Tax=Botrytis fragariae TaxID=1964551 RepID=A0A8H6AN57_9HELO|nr:putative dna polymerase delta subunit 4 protein [Botrytis fragariae]KAF5870592.1 putative dna polymerase delta subunit 4 protein [Botrytis fragariae]